MWYHFAFVAVSIALFGLTVGALIVHFFPGWFGHDGLLDRLALAGSLFSAAIVLSFVVHLQIPFEAGWSLRGVGIPAATYLVVSVPFICSGVVVSATLTRYAGQVGRLYAADLAGAALGTVTLVWLLNISDDAPSVVLAVAALAAVGAFCYALGSRRQLLLGVAGFLALVLALLAASNAALARSEDGFLRIVRVKGVDEERPLFETWNAFSRIQVFGDRSALQVTDGADVRTKHLGMTIDATAGTLLTSYNGDPSSITFLREDIVSLAHHLRPASNVLIIGTGGGGEVLLSLSFGHPSVTAVEMNGAILDIVNDRYGDFTGHLDQQPGVRFINDEGRAFIERSNERYDILQIPFTDTWAATGAGAFALSENGLYTVDAWQEFFDHLTPTGLLTVTRWYFPPDPIESYRITALAAQALRRAGVEDPRMHIALVRNTERLPGVFVSNILVSKQPFTKADLAALDQIVEERGWEVLLAPDRESLEDPRFVQIVEREDVGAINTGYPADITPPTDDRPCLLPIARVSAK
jgi:hypothetical protein